MKCTNLTQTPSKNKKERQRLVFMRPENLIPTPDKTFRKKGKLQASE